MVMIVKILCCFVVYHLPLVNILHASDRSDTWKERNIEDYACGRQNLGPSLGRKVKSDSTDWERRPNR